MHLGHHGAGDLDCVVLLGHGPVVAQVVGTVVDAADERALPIDHHDLAVQAAKQVGAHAREPGLGVEGMKVDAGVGHRRDEGVGQVGSAVAIDRHLDAHTTASGRYQHLLQLLADLVIENDERLQQNFFPRLGHRLEYAGVVLFAVDQQLHAVAL